MPKTLLVMPPMTIHKQSLKRCLIPLGISYIAAVLQQHNFEVFILDAMAEGYEKERLDGEDLTYGLSDDEILSRIESLRPDIVGISCIFSSQRDNVVSVASLVKRYSSQVTTVVGGLHPTFYPDDLLSSPSIDYVILGEGEDRFLKFVRNYETRGFNDFDGIAFRSENGFVVNPPQRRIEHLDSIPFPARNRLKMEKYIDINISLSPYPRRKRVAEIMTSRGCPGRCIFCASCNFWGHKFRKRSVDNIIEEMQLLINEYGIEEFQFSDDNLTLDKKRMKELCRAMGSLNVNWCTPNGVFINSLDEELLELMKNSGCYQVTFAVESASPRVLKEIMHKPVDLKRLPVLTRKAHQLGISTHATFVMGFPEETLEEIEEDFKLAFKLMFDSVSFFIVMPLPGSEMIDTYREKGLLSGYDLHQVEFKKSILRLNHLSPEQLTLLIDAKMRKYNRSLMLKHPIRFFRKYGRFILRKPRYMLKIFGRVT